MTARRCRTARPADAAYDYCETLTRRAASNFYWAFRLLPPTAAARSAAVYAFCRAADDMADEPGLATAARLLARWREELGTPSTTAARAPRSGSRSPTPSALAIAARALRGGGRRRRDGPPTRPLRDAGRTTSPLLLPGRAAVGPVCIEIFGYRNQSAREYAVELGLAFQLTNILRDVAEDAARGRIYLPLDDLRRFGAEEDVLAGRMTEPFRRHGVLNVEARGHSIPRRAVPALVKLAERLAERVAAIETGPALDLSTLARLFVHVSSLRNRRQLPNWQRVRLGACLISSRLKSP